MSDLPVPGKRTLSPAPRAPHPRNAACIQPEMPGTDRMPKAVITGDIRLRVSESFAARRAVKGHYRIETEGMQEPLQVIWISEGKVINHSVHAIEIVFDARGMSAGETLTTLLTAQVQEKDGQGCIVHSSVFIQIFVMGDESSDAYGVAQREPHSLKT
jgi:hypothetical protein